MGIFRRRATSGGRPWWWPPKPDRRLVGDVVRMNAELMPWSRMGRLMVRASDRRDERLRAEDEVQRRLDALAEWTPPPGREEPHEPVEERRTQEG